MTMLDLYPDREDRIARMIHAHLTKQVDGGDYVGEYVEGYTVIDGTVDLKVLLRLVASLLETVK